MKRDALPRERKVGHIGRPIVSLSVVRENSKNRAHNVQRAHHTQTKYYGVWAGDVHTFLAAHLLAAHRAASAIAAMSRVAELIPHRLSCSDSRDSSLFARGGLGSGE